MGLTSSRFGSKLTCNHSPCFSPSTTTSNTLIKTLKRLRNDSTWGERALGEIEKKRLNTTMGMCLRPSLVERDIDQAITALKKGSYLLKYGRRGKLKFCPFRLSTADKASMLDEAIEYLKTLQLQVQGLKTGMYHLRSRAAADAIKFIVDTSMIKDEPKATVDDENTKMVQMVLPSEMVQSNKEYTEEDVTNQVIKGIPLESSGSSHI